MAELNFPANPQIDDEYTFNNLLYKYDGEKWTTWGSGANTALDLRNELASTQGASMVVTASGNTVQEELDMVGSGLSLEPLRRSYAEAGFDMDISESFALGGTLNAANEVLLGEGLIGYSWGGAFPKEVPPNSTPLDTGGIGSAGWIDQSHNTLRAQAKTYIDNADAALQADLDGKSPVGHTHTAVDVGAVAKTGDTMTGTLTIDANTGALKLKADAAQSSYVLSEVGGVNNWFVGKGSTADDISLHSYAYDTALQLRSDNIFFNKDPRTGAAQGSNAASLTRKDYVDAALLVKADVDRVNTLEATITALLARIEALEQANNSLPL